MLKTYTTTKVHKSGDIEACAIKLQSDDRALRWYNAVNDKFSKGELDFYMEDLEECDPIPWEDNGETDIDFWKH